MTKKPYAWQEKALERFASAKQMALVVACGCGKSLAAIRIALAKQLPVIIIAPGHRLCKQWENDIREAVGKEADVWLYNKQDETKQGDYYKEEFQKWLTAR